jgi:hypothetical protein
MPVPAGLIEIIFCMDFEPVYCGPLQHELAVMGHPQADCDALRACGSLRHRHQPVDSAGATAWFNGRGYEIQKTNRITHVFRLFPALFQLETGLVQYVASGLRRQELQVRQRRTF